MTTLLFTVSTMLFNISLKKRKKTKPYSRDLFISFMHLFISGFYSLEHLPSPSIPPAYDNHHFIFCSYDRLLHIPHVRICTMYSYCFSSYFFPFWEFHVAQYRLELVMQLPMTLSSWSSCLQLPSVRIVNMHTPPHSTKNVYEKRLKRWFGH